MILFLDMCVYMCVYMHGNIQIGVGDYVHDFIVSLMCV